MGDTEHGSMSSDQLGRHIISEENRKAAESAPHHPLAENFCTEIQRLHHDKLSMQEVRDLGYELYARAEVYYKTALLLQRNGDLRQQITEALKVEDETVKVAQADKDWPQVNESTGEILAYKQVLRWTAEPPHELAARLDELLHEQAKDESLFLTRLKPHEYRKIMDAHMTFSGSTGENALPELYNGLAPYIATFLGNLYEAVQLLGWERPHLRRRGNQWFLREKILGEVLEAEFKIKG